MRLAQRRHGGEVESGERLRAAGGPQLDEQSLGEAALGERAAEAAERGLVWRAVVEPEAEEAAEREAISQRLLEAGIGQLIPLRQQQRPEQRQRWVARPPCRGAQRGEQPLQRRPVDQASNALQPAIGPAPAGNSTSVTVL
jgi:hypothetical protein